MARDARSHESVVEEWMGNVEGSTSKEVLSRFEAAMLGLWQRAQPTLGVLTLGAIADRVFYTARERFPFLTPLESKDGNVRFDELGKQVDAVSPVEMAAAAQFVVVEFLTVLGHLTAEILTPALHEALSTGRRERRAVTPARRRAKE